MSPPFPELMCCFHRSHINLKKTCQIASKSSFHPLYSLFFHGLAGLHTQHRLVNVPFASRPPAVLRARDVSSCCHGLLFLNNWSGPDLMILMKQRMSGRHRLLRICLSPKSSHHKCWKWIWADSHVFIFNAVGRWCLRTNILTESRVLRRSWQMHLFPLK